MKSYKLIKGNCNNCCLKAECKDRKEAIQHYLNSMGLFCKDGYMIGVVDE